MEGVCKGLEPRYNAVVIHLIDVGDNRFAKQFTIECKDETMLPQLQILAREYMGKLFPNT